MGNQSMNHEFVASELKKLVGYGADPKRLALMPYLRQVKGIEDGTDPATAGYILREWLDKTTRTIPGHEFMGRQLEAHILRRVLRLLLKFEGTGLDAAERRKRVIIAVGVYYSVDQWRRPVGPERELLGILAEALCQTSIT